MRNIAKISSILLLAVSVMACGKKPEPKTGVNVKGEDGKDTVVGAEAQKNYDAALENFIKHDKAADWNDASCEESAQAFLRANEQNKKDLGGKELAPAVYNVGLAYQRCNKDAEAKKYFAQALGIDGKFHRAKVQIALYDYKAGGDAALEPTIQALQQAVLDAEFQNTEALVNLAMLEMKRGSATGWQGCQSDLECAKKNIQRALAVDDGYMPAFNQLAIYYLERAKEKVGRKTSKVVAGRKKEKKIDQQQLELAALVCSQAIRKNPKYAPIHNTAGLIQVELGNINSAVQEFKVASDIDPGFFEAQMNYAAVNLSFRGFKNAEDAYRASLKLKPNDYDAHLGLALAIRGQINDSNWDANVKDAQAMLDKAKEISPERPETYYNAGILTQEFKVKGITNEKEKIPVLDAAAALYNDFINKAGPNPDFADAVKRAKERIRDIEDIKKFITEGIKAAEEAPPPVDQPGGLEGPKEGEGGEPKPPEPEKKPLSGAPQHERRPSRVAFRVLWMEVAPRWSAEAAAVRLTFKRDRRSDSRNLFSASLSVSGEAGEPRNAKRVRSSG